MFEDLGKLIVAVQTNYDRICNIWTDKSELQINLKKKLVIDAREDAEILNSIWKYRSIISVCSLSNLFFSSIRQL